MISYEDRPNDYEAVSSCMFKFPLWWTSHWMSVLTDFRNKFGAFHQSYTPNRERELFSKCCSRSYDAPRWWELRSSSFDGGHWHKAHDHNYFQWYVVAIFRVVIWHSTHYIVRDIIIKHNLKNLALVWAIIVLRHFHFPLTHHKLSLAFCFLHRPSLVFYWNHPFDHLQLRSRTPLVSTYFWP